MLIDGLAAGLLECVSVCVRVDVGSYALRLGLRLFVPNLFTALVCSLLEGVWFSASSLSAIFFFCHIFSPFLHFIALHSHRYLPSLPIPLLNPSLYPSESSQCFRGCAGRAKRAGERGARSLNGAVAV